MGSLDLQTLSVSCEVDYDGYFARRGDGYMPALLYEAAAVMITRSIADSSLRRWSLELRERVGFRRAAVALGLSPWISSRFE